MGVHLVSGEDPSLLAAAAHQLIHALIGSEDPAFALEEFDPGVGEIAIDAVIDAATTPPMFSAHRVVVLRGVEGLDKASLSAVLGALGATEASSEWVLVYRGRVPKAVSTAVEQAAGHHTTVDAPSSAKARQGWLDRELTASGLRFDAAAQRAIGAWLGEEPGRLAGLVQLLESAHGSGARITLADVEPHLGPAGGVPPWDLTDAIDRGDTAVALGVLARMMGAGARHPLQILAVLHGHVERIARLDGVEARSPDEAATVLGLRPNQSFQARKVLDTHRRWGSAATAKAIALLADADMDLRGDTAWSPEMVMEVLVARLSRLKR